MNANDNSVNIISKPSYHHGDLRAALIDAGVRALDGAPVEELSLRALAREIGVSATAVYRHFPDKEALLAALALAGLDRMGDSQRLAARRARGLGAAAAFCASGAAYVRFAIKHPAMFRVIWRTPPAADVLTTPVVAMHPTLLALRDGIASVLPPDASEEDRRAAALRSWGLVHGLAMLALDGQVQLDDAMIDRVIDGYAGVVSEWGA